MKLTQISSKRIIQFAVSVSIVFIICYFAPPINAQVVFSDDFSGGYEKWYDVRNTFDLWSIVDEQANVYIPRRSTLAEVIPKDSYWDEAWKNYVYSLDYTYLQGADKAISFWYKNILNWYQIHFVGNNYILSHIKNGKEIWRKSGGLVLEAGKTHQMELHLNDGTIQFFMDSNKVFEYFDETFDNDHGKIGLKSGAGNIYPTHVMFDNIKVSLFNSVEDFLLEINILKQTDTNWKDEEYDSATTWAEIPTINEWGCLVTSINMILTYHGITQFPDGTLITPNTLNTWLKNQEDGYIKNGLVNWSAVTRLVRQISEVYGTTKLEYSKSIGSSFAVAQTNIQELRPVILEINGHFLVGNGFTQNYDDLYISDPAYSYEKISQHLENEKELLSTRLLTPSNTNLSYIHIAHSNKISVTVTDAQGEQPQNYSQQTQYLQNFSNTQETEKSIFHELQKPTTQKYQLQISSNTGSPEPYELTIFTYDTDANFSNLSYSGIAGVTTEAVQNTTVIDIEYSSQGTSKLQTHITFENLLKDISAYRSHNRITKQYVVTEISNLIKLAQENTLTHPENISRYTEATVQLIDWYNKHISVETQGYLKTKLSEIK